MGVGLTLTIDAEHVAAFRRHASLRQHALSKAHARRTLDAHYDTPDFGLHRRQVALRINRTGRIWSQILSCGGMPAGLPQRTWEMALSGEQPDCAALAVLLKKQAALRRILVDRSTVDRLAPMFSIDCRNTLWQLRLTQGQRIDLVLKQGTIRAGQSERQFTHIEIELAAGEPSALYEFALSLQHDIPLRIAYVTPTEIGYALAGLPMTGPANARRVVLPDEPSVEQGIRIILSNCVAQIQGNVRGVAQSDDIEYLHQMRIGLRRLRSALSIFSDTIMCPSEIQTDLKWLTEQLGRARDWDVLGTSTLPAIATSMAGVSDLAQLLNYAEWNRNENRAQVAQAADSVRMSSIWLRLQCWLEEIGNRHSADAAAAKRLSMPLDLFAELVVRRFQHKLRARCTGIEAAEELRRHRLRITTKKLRYAIEFFVSCLAAKQTHRLVTRLVALQDSLGRSNDIVVANRLLLDVAQQRPEFSHACAFCRGYLASTTKSELRGLEKIAGRVAVLKAIHLKVTA